MPQWLRCSTTGSEPGSTWCHSRNCAVCSALSWGCSSSMRSMRFLPPAVDATVSRRPSPVVSVFTVSSLPSPVVSLCSVSNLRSPVVSRFTVSYTPSPRVSVYTVSMLPSPVVSTNSESTCPSPVVSLHTLLDSCAIPTPRPSASQLALRRRVSAFVPSVPACDCIAATALACAAPDPGASPCAAFASRHVSAPVTATLPCRQRDRLRWYSTSQTPPRCAVPNTRLW